MGALDGVEIYHPESFLAFDHGGVMVHFYRDLDRLQSSWLALSPQDEKAINEFCTTIKRLQSYETPVGKPVDLMGIAEKIRYMLSMKDVGMVLQKYGKVSLKEYAKTFKHPALCEALASLLPDGYSDYDAWYALFQDSKAYSREKSRIGQEVIRSIETRFPQMKGKLNLLDVATPKTFERYCNAYRGAFMSFLPTVGGKMMPHTGRIIGLQNIFLSGQWLQPPGGLPVALVTGKDTIMRLCKMRKQPFIY